MAKLSAFNYQSTLPICKTCFPVYIFVDILVRPRLLLDTYLESVCLSRFLIENTFYRIYRICSLGNIHRMLTVLYRFQVNTIYSIFNFRNTLIVGIIADVIALPTFSLWYSLAAPLSGVVCKIIQLLLNNIHLSPTLTQSNFNLHCQHYCGYY